MSTTAQLYALYRRCYDDYDRELASALLTRQAGLAPIERAVAEFALQDAVNGTVARSFSQFERAVAEGADALGPLGLSSAA